MKTFLVIAAIFGLSSSAAFAQCAGYVTASAKAKDEITTASIVPPATEENVDAALLLKRQQTEEQAALTK